MAEQVHAGTERFRFHSNALANHNEDVFVLRFHGVEGISTLYSFEIDLVSKTILPIEEMLAEHAQLRILRKQGEEVIFSGYPSSLVQTGHYRGWTFYSVTLRPAFWKYTQLVRNTIFVDENIQQTISTLLDSVPSLPLHYTFKLYNDYPNQAFSMQHNESIFDYLSWRMEREGIYYYFEHNANADSEQLIFTDAMLTHAPLTQPTLRYSGHSGLESQHQEELIASFALHCQALPQKVVLRDYDWLHPNHPVVAQAVVSEHGLGEVYFYGDGFRTHEEGMRLAQIRAEGLRCQGKIFHGLSSVPCLRPGFTFHLDKHYDPSLNSDYLLTKVRHEGSQEAWIRKAIGIPLQGESDQFYYRNEFSCIPKDIQFRPERTAKRAKVSGMLTAFIDASTDSGIPELSPTGCYRVVFPQDLSGRSNGKASCWIRRMQSHVGQGYGSSFPLAAGVEVLIAFMDGDPDRPVIAGAVSNAETGFQETASASQTTGLRTEGGNALLFSEEGRKQSMLLGTGGNSGLLMNSNEGVDRILQYTTSSDALVTSMSDSFSGLASSSVSGFENSIVACNTWTTGTIVSSALSTIATTLNSAGQATWSDNTTVNTALDLGLGIVSDILNAASTFAHYHDLWLKYNVDAKYYGVLSASKGLSKVRLQADISTKAIVKYLTFAATTMLGQATDIALDAGNLAVAIKNDVDAETFSKKSAVRNISQTLFNALLPELVATILLFNKKRQLGNKMSDPGGFLIDSPEANILINAKTDTRLLSDNVVGLATYPGASKLCGTKTHKEILDAHYVKERHQDYPILQQAGTIYSFACNDIKMRAGKNYSLVAAEKIELTNKSDTKDLLDDLQQLKTNLTTASESLTTYLAAQKSIDGLPETKTLSDILELLSELTAITASLQQKSAQYAQLCFERSTEGKSICSLVNHDGDIFITNTPTQDSGKISISNALNASKTTAATLSMDKHRTSLVYKKDTEEAGLEIGDDLSVSLSAKDTVISIDSASEEIKNSAKTIVLEASDSVSMLNKGVVFTPKSFAVKTSQGSLSCENGMLTLNATTTIKLG